MTTLPRRDAFFLPVGIYFDGNSLGPLSLGAQAAIERRLAQWQHRGVSAWDEWFALAERLSPALARLLGARSAEVIATGSITANLHNLLATFYRPEGDRRTLVATDLDFPSDLYALAAWSERLNGSLRLINRSRSRARRQRQPPFRRHRIAPRRSPGTASSRCTGRQFRTPNATPCTWLKSPASAARIRRSSRDSGCSTT